MNATCLLLIVASGPPTVEVHEAEPVAVRVDGELDREALRRWYHDLAARTARRSRTPADEAIPQLVALHEVLVDVDGVSPTELLRMRSTVRGRIEWYGGRLRRQVSDAKRRGGATKSRTAAGGAATLANARSLIDLIQRTVNPPIWDVNGGNSSIGYFAPYQALVVRTTGDGHFEISDVLGQMRRAGP